MTTNHPAHDPVSLDRLHQISEILSKAAAQSDGGNLGYAMADAVKVINGVIVSFGAEPVLYAMQGVNLDTDAVSTCKSVVDGWVDEWNQERKPGVPEYKTVPLYIIPPAPVVPETLPCPVHLDPGIKFGKGVRTQCVLDALRRRADYYAELEAMTPEQRAEHDAGIAEFKAMLGHDSRAAMLQVGNSPVSPDCWCRTCRPVTMSDMRFVVCPDCGNKRCPHANDHRNACTGSNEPGQIGSAYPAAPKQEE